MTKFVWIDLETTGLDENHCQIIEVASIITDGSLNVLGTYETLVQPEVLTFEPGVIGMHKRSGLFDRISRGAGKNIKTAEQELMAFITQHEPHKRRAYFAGNSVHFDERFLRRYMPSITPHMCSRHLDVSAVGLAMRARFGKDTAEFKASRPHRAMEDLERALEELRFYMTEFVRFPEELSEPARSAE